MKKPGHLIFNILLLTAFYSTTVQAAVEGITTGAELQTEAEKHIRTIDTEELAQVIEEDLEMVLIDIRMPSEVTGMGGAIKADQNVNIPRGWLEYRVTRVALSKDTPIVVYCGAGIRSPMAALRLQEMGYTNVRNYPAGFLGWREAGKPVAK